MCPCLHVVPMSSFCLHVCPYIYWLSLSRLLFQQHLLEIQMTYYKYQPYDQGWLLSLQLVKVTCVLHELEGSEWQEGETDWVHASMRIHTRIFLICVSFVEISWFFLPRRNWWSPTMICLQLDSWCWVQCCVLSSYSPSLNLTHCVPDNNHSSLAMSYSVGFDQCLCWWSWLSCVGVLSWSCWSWLWYRWPWPCGLCYICGHGAVFLLCYLVKAYLLLGISSHVLFWFCLHLHVTCRCLISILSLLL